MTTWITVELFCDKCDIRFPHVTKGRSGRTEKLRAEASGRGWTTYSEGKRFCYQRDLCAECSAEREAQP